MLLQRTVIFQEMGYYYHKRVRRKETQVSLVTLAMSLHNQLVFFQLLPQSVWERWMNADACAVLHQS